MYQNYEAFARERSREAEATAAAYRVTERARRAQVAARWNRVADWAQRRAVRADRTATDLRVSSVRHA